MSHAWIPTGLEETCLRHLDHAENWRLLNRPQPPETEELPWSPFKRIFLINIVQFLLVTGALLGAGLFAISRDPSLGTVQEYLLPGFTFIVVTSASLAMFVASLYRRSWNRRARYLREEEAKEQAHRRS